MKRLRARARLVSATLFLAPALASAAPDSAPDSASAGPSYRLSAIDRVWSGHSVGFAMAVTADLIVVGYYDAARQLTVASRSLRADTWVYRRVDSWVGWDSHNSIALAVDAAGQIHVAANMHNDPLVYYRTDRAGDVRTLRRHPVMVAERVERRVTYPVFLRDAGGRLIFTYRDGGSGNGDQIYDVYDPATARWAAAFAGALIDGEGKRNAYPVEPVRGPDGWFHLVWVWRDTPAAETNHDLSHARSRDLVHWERSDGTPLTLPIRLSAAEIIDPVPARGGMINGNTAIGFDPTGAVMVTYHKFDAAGDTQIYVARREAGRWRIVQVSDWRGFRWDFSGGGSLDSRVTVAGPVALDGDRIGVSVVRDGVPIRFVLDARTLRRIGEEPDTSLATWLATRLPPPAGMKIHVVADGHTGLAIGWSARSPDRDRAGEDIPDPTVLRLIEDVSPKTSGPARR